MLGRNSVWIAVGVVQLGLVAGWACAQTAEPGPRPPTDKALYLSHGDLDTVWSDLEARQAINKRVLDAGRYSINIRTIKETSAPLVHSSSIDIWIMQEGSAVSVTGGTLKDPKKGTAEDSIAGSAIEGGTEQPFLPGDVLYVPAGLPHGFKNVKGFRAILIRVDLK